ncbi:hypothetical protein V5799_027869 [Amblyomma americanum]|uniref:Serine/threonine-protein kinase ATR n=1 Tax=Amblyomma americanum TaxID=6943 RepID=A0AAQ4DEH4_AMBAM
MRVQRCKEVFQLARHQNSTLAKFLNDTLALCDMLLELCNRPVGETHVLLISAQVKDLHKMLEQPYTARQSYAQTVAVMSIVGFILGLGDRHGENILFDASCGDAVHVDFNCLFNKA